MKNEKNATIFYIFFVHQYASDFMQMVYEKEEHRKRRQIMIYNQKDVKLKTTLIHKRRFTTILQYIENVIDLRRNKRLCFS